MNTTIEFKLMEWLYKATTALNATGYAQDIHIDLIFDDNLSLLNNEELFERCCFVVKTLIKIIKKAEINLENTEIFLAIDLISETNKFSGAPKTKDDLIKSIDRYSVPEIILYKNNISTKVLFNEFYRTPLLYDIFEHTDNVVILYKEYKDEGSLPDNDYTKDLNIIYRPGKSTVH